jgi:hypothetical protein
VIRLPAVTGQWRCFARGAAGHGELGAAIAELAKKVWRHPTTGESVRFGASTVERWFYLARNEPADPVAALVRKVHSHAGSMIRASRATPGPR